MTDVVSVPIVGSRSGLKLRVSVERGSGLLDGFQEVVDSGDYSGAMKQGPEIIRRGRGGYAEQIRERVWITPTGGRVAWVNPAYAEGKFPDAARQREGVIWSAALGGIGGTQAYGQTWFEVGIDDDSVKRTSTAIGNRLPVPEGVSYAGFVTGGIGIRTLPIKRAAIPVKPSRAKKTKNWKRRYAMYIFLGLAYKKWMTDEEMREGLYTPPKRIGYNPEIEKSLNAMYSKWWRKEAAARSAA